MVGYVSTDYFGGIGDQSSKLYFNGEKVYDSHMDDYDRYDQINILLREKMNVARKQGMDEFDTIGLGRYRSNKDFETEYKKRKQNNKK